MRVVGSSGVHERLESRKRCGVPAHRSHCTEACSSAIATVLTREMTVLVEISSSTLAKLWSPLLLFILETADSSLSYTTEKLSLLETPKRRGKETKPGSPNQTPRHNRHNGCLTLWG